MYINRYIQRQTRQIVTQTDWRRQIYRQINKPGMQTDRKSVRNLDVEEKTKSQTKKDEESEFTT